VRPCAAAKTKSGVDRSVSDGKTGIYCFARLVALQRADEVPANIGAKLIELGELGERFLDVVFAEIAVAGIERLPGSVPPLVATLQS
jgi:hypothetical protein